LSEDAVALLHEAVQLVSDEPLVRYSLLQKTTSIYHCLTVS